MINLQKYAIAIKCPNCGKKVEAPTKKIENSCFYLAAYTCKECGTSFKVSY